MNSSVPDPKIIALVSDRLTAAEIIPIMIGGMALVIYGSTRHTRDCDFAAPKTEDTLRRSVHTMLDEGFEVIFGWDGDRHIPTKTESDKVIAGSWAVIDRPESIWFWHPGLSIRIDLVFDLPVPIEDVLSRANTRTIQGARIFIAAPEDLQIMKEVAYAARPAHISDEQDLVYIRHLLSTAKKKPSS